MHFALVYSRARIGIDAPLITIEVHLSNGLPAFNIVGLPEASVRESRERVRSALLNAGFEFPARRMTVNLAPADIPKEGSRFDLPIAIGILAASDQLKCEALDHFEFIGELGLTSELRRIDASLPAAMQCESAGRKLILPTANAAEIQHFVSATLRAVDNLGQTVALLQGEADPSTIPERTETENGSTGDFADIIGQHGAKRALEIAAAGAHNLLFSGPPGTGKTLIASRLPSILPPLTRQELLESSAIHSVAGNPVNYRANRPFRSPHHTASAVSLVGGGSHACPGEVSLAHGGVLFLDELPEYPRKVLDVLREPLEAGEITIARANRKIRYPARFQLLAAMNPCPCGYHNDPLHECRCTPDQVRRYRNRISGPLLDRIDLFVHVPRLPPGSLQNTTQEESSELIASRVSAARERQFQRAGCCNAQLDASGLREFCPLDSNSRDLLGKAEARLGLSPRAQHRIIKVARTLADLEGAASISLKHLSEALTYRQMPA
ncbi:magnesium chelatase family protein [Litorivivens lipolytica]|uniref:Magnesium chelatase family protein n=1 Tax=Litorivivens lipolytica TaxID=1524264 RepID=A0A7W4W7A8_9GAMM|nr:YifB family Mg chelatase-like AAA ATPase [Litorivivens lipolytica]MBB3048836.1 magnesium chelatase family protein [Litorivivens lipolytica]